LLYNIAQLTKIINQSYISIDIQFAYIRTIPINEFMIKKKKKLA